MIGAEIWLAGPFPDGLMRWPIKRNLKEHILKHDHMARNIDIMPQKSVVYMYKILLRYILR
jgi:hypothetical protein